MTFPPGTFDDLRSSRRTIGAWGESVAAAFLAGHGADVLDRNIRVGSGEVDLHVAFGATVVAVEVKTLLSDAAASTDPLRSYTSAKADQVHRLARALRPRPQRIDVVAVVASPGGVALRWVRGA